MKCYDWSNAEIRAAYQKEPRLTTAAEFEQVLRSLGMYEGMQINVHSSLSSLGSFEGGAENLCRVLQRIVTEKGTLMMPGLSGYPADGVDCCYDPDKSPVRVGVVPDTFRKLPGVVRSWDPTHSFCAWGRDKEYFVRNHHKLPTMDKDSPLGLLEQADGFCLMIGCRASVTFMHVVETSNGAHCLGQRAEEYSGTIAGKKVKLRGWNWRGGICPAIDQEKIYGFMREENTVRETMLGHCHLVLFKLSDYRTAYTRCLNDPETGCAACSILPRRVSQCVPSDWDTEKRCLKDSDAFTGDWKSEFFKNQL